MRDMPQQAQAFRSDLPSHLILVNYYTAPQYNCVKITPEITFEFFRLALLEPGEKRPLESFQRQETFGFRRLSCPLCVTAVYNWKGDKSYGLPLEIGDTVQIQEECLGEIRPSKFFSQLFPVAPVTTRLLQRQARHQRPCAPGGRPPILQLHFLGQLPSAARAAMG